MTLGPLSSWSEGDSAWQVPSPSGRRRGRRWDVHSGSLAVSSSLRQCRLLFHQKRCWLMVSEVYSLYRQRYYHTIDYQRGTVLEMPRGDPPFGRGKTIYVADSRRGTDPPLSSDSSTRVNVSRKEHWTDNNRLFFYESDVFSFRGRNHPRHCPSRTLRPRPRCPYILRRKIPSQSRQSGNHQRRRTTSLDNC